MFVSLKLTSKLQIFFILGNGNLKKMTLTQVIKSQGSYSFQGFAFKRDIFFPT